MRSFDLDQDFSAKSDGSLERGNRPVSVDHLDLDGWDSTAALLLTLLLGILGVLDNVLKPPVIGRGLATPTLVIFVGAIGGTLAHGIVGFFIGPVILSVAWELTVAWIRGDRDSAGA